MFFLHALAIRRAKLEEEGDTEGLAALPTVTCFERSSGPGGVWRSDRFSADDGDAKSTNMYEALWTNGPKEAMEFFDHTYQEHFGCPLPTFLPRECVLSYLVTRCTKNNPNFFNDVKFNTEVKLVTYDEESDKFIVELPGNTEHTFDVCIWAAGANGKPKIPLSMEAALRPGFKGKMMHSSQTDSNFDQHVRGKTVMIIGDQFSAEDLALQAIKLGVDSVQIVTRSGEGVASDTSAWPMDKVDVHQGWVPSGVARDGYGIMLSKVAYDYDQEKFVENSDTQITLDGIDTIIFCTGYNPNIEMLDEELIPWDRLYAGEELPTDTWRMSENALSEDIGDVKLTKIRDDELETSYADIYRGRLISVSSMFFMYEESNVPLLNLDIIAWRTLAQITGDLPLPQPEEMHQFNISTLLDAMNIPEVRYLADDNYRKQWDQTIGRDHWVEDHRDHRCKAMTRSHWDHQYRVLARDALDSGYPVDIGTYEKLNEKGNDLVSSNMVCEFARYEMDNDSPNASWETFRDCDPSKCHSIFTGTKAAPLKKHWLELESCEIVDIVDIPPGEDEETVLAEKSSDYISSPCSKQSILICPSITTRDYILTDDRQENRGGDEAESIRDNQVGWQEPRDKPEADGVAAIEFATGSH